ncbi:MAG: MBL fold metallo-hydrolase, partial [Oscillospiraceae bacterium]|nr:MBL fold metallo-hydrolase [Oscillospiraceae bacterium]
MMLSVLANGSKGNATFVAMDGKKILIDAGVSATRIRRALAALGADAGDLDAVFVTHEHIDHVRGLRNLLRDGSIPVYSRARTLELLGDVVPIASRRPVEEHFSIGAIAARAFSISHDAADPVGYRLEGSEIYAHATDLGFVSSGVQEALEGADHLVLEANHDPVLLKEGRYPWNLKRRIASQLGHLSNVDAGWAIVRMKR